MVCNECSSMLSKCKMACAQIHYKFPFDFFWHHLRNINSIFYNSNQTIGIQIYAMSATHPLPLQEAKSYGKFRKKYLESLCRFYDVLCCGFSIYQYLYNPMILGLETEMSSIPCLFAVIISYRNGYKRLTQETVYKTSI